MVCIYCGHASKVTNSRPHKRNQQIWRRRQCLHCQRVWSTYETADSTTLVIVRLADGQLKPFSRDKLLISIFNSCQHRPEAIADASALTATVMPKIYQQQQDGSITVHELSSLVATVLERFDTAAAVHYRAFHRL